MSSESESDFSLWRFSLQYYGRPGIAEACIELQDSCGADVNLLLFLLWIASLGRQMSFDEVKAVEDAVGAWRSKIIAPLRSVRRDLKLSLPLAPADQTAALRQRVKSLELAAEKLQQAAMHQLAVASAPGRPAASTRAAARVNIAHCQRLVLCQFPEAIVDRLVEVLDEAS